MDSIKKKRSNILECKTHYHFKPAQMNTIDQERRNHFYLGLAKSAYHEHYDKFYHQILERRKRVQIKKAIMEQDGNQNLGWYDFKILRKKHIVLWTLRREMVPFYGVCKIIKLIACFLTTILYPFYNVNGFPKFHTLELWFLIMLESIFAIEILVNFFMQTLDEEGKSRNEPLENVSFNYFKGGFTKDLLVLLPLGWIFSFADERFKILWLVKAIRIKTLHHSLSKRSFEPFIAYYISYLQGDAFTNEELRYQTQYD